MTRKDERTDFLGILVGVYPWKHFWCISFWRALDECDVRTPVCCKSELITAGKLQTVLKRILQVIDVDN